MELFLNARCDVFFGDGEPSKLIGQALDRAKAYAAAGGIGILRAGPD